MSTPQASTVSYWRKRAGECLPGAEASREMDLLLMQVLDRPHAWLHAWPEHELTAQQTGRLESLMARRRAGEPLAYILGEQAFWTLNLHVTPAVLIPRPDTECVVEKVLELGQGKVWRVADLGTGSGAIALSLAAEHPEWEVTATDISPDSLAIARANAERNHLPHVRFCCGDWLEPLEGRYDCLVSNPPYIVPGDPHLDQLVHEPLRALVAHDEGLADLRTLARLSGNFLRPGGWLVLEHGYDQHLAVQELLRDAGFTAIDSGRDYGGNWRYTFGRTAC